MVAEGWFISESGEPERLQTIGRSIGGGHCMKPNSLRAPSRLRRTARLGAAAAVMLPLVANISGPASADPPTDPLHGGTGVGVTVDGHSDLGGQGLNGHVAVLGNYAYVGNGTNGAFAAQWNKAPTCKLTAAQGAPLTNKVKVVDLGAQGTNPTVVSTISVGNTTVAPDGGAADITKTLARDVDAIDVEPITAAQIAGTAFTGKLLAIAKETCNTNLNKGESGVEFWDVNDAANPVLLGKDDRNIGSSFVSATRQVSLVQRPDGNVYAFEANQQGFGAGGGLHMVDITNPAAPVTVGRVPNSSSNQILNPAPIQECRPFSLPQGVTPNATGTRAYGSYMDGGLLRIDSSNPSPGAFLPVLSHTKYADAGAPLREDRSEGNTFRFVPNDNEETAIVTDEDLLPARTYITVSGGTGSSAFTEPGGTNPGEFLGCEYLWGAPLYERATPSVSGEIVFINGGGCQASQYAGLNLTGKIALIFRGGVTSTGGTCFFEEKAKRAQDPNQDGDRSDGAIAVLLGNTATDHHGGGPSTLFSGDSLAPVDAGVFIPIISTTREMALSIIGDIGEDEVVTANVEDRAETWGALRVFDISGSAPVQTAIANAPHTNVLTPGEGLYHAVNTVWKGNGALTAWMSDGLRQVDLSDRTAPQFGSFYVPPAVADPTGNYPTVPLVVDVERWKNKVVITDINGGLYVLRLATSSTECLDHAQDVTACQLRFATHTPGTPPPWSNGIGAGGNGESPESSID